MFRIYNYCHPWKNFNLFFIYLFKMDLGGAWVAQMVKCPTWAQVMISRFVSCSPASGSGLTAQRLEPALSSVCVSLSAPSLCSLFLSLSLSLSQK